MAVEVDYPFLTQFVRDIAIICHHANKAICESFGDNSQKSWKDAEEWQRDSAMKGVIYALKNPDSTPKDQHEAWCKEKVLQGWKYGPIKNPETKEHPCLIEYEKLPPEQQVKDHVFREIVSVMCHE